ncbi:pentatricopeptide repeat-containing protein At3g04130, mitochondrial isoform X2 [Amborella trichopoda]|uniref:pentatricopeptide repeat-containing protein At3g04130, mitochondrial isoform X2 n=1 Tax=Amborella trichopoda TaxID=13333 RepID=UPI0009BF94CF|nr:pentatricopeptide repeat-containing protein At3g04130, mitochondrial isoform X2 [Amborella trichopoda]|eukprot:XP_020519884.1 pentatricopeptide repeat-containing protein At3g04130, mitochondrial isoform X2 [Amborella trichopoda]
MLARHIVPRGIWVFGSVYFLETLETCFTAANSINGLLNGALRGFCNFSESSELPEWIKNPKVEPFVDYMDDDFVLPANGVKKVDWIDNLEKFDHKTISRVSSSEDTDKIGSLLENLRDSPEDLWRALDNCGVKVSETLVNKVLRRYNDDWISALNFFRWASKQVGFVNSTETYDMMVDILGKMKQFDKMWDIVEEMRKIGGLISLSTVSKMMRRLSGAGKWKDTIDVFYGIESLGLRKDTSSMNVVLDTLCKERNVERARDLFLVLGREIPPNAHTFNVLIHGWCKAKRLEEAEWTMREMKGYGFNPCVISYTSLVEAYCSLHDFQNVEALLNEMEAKGCPPSVVTYTVVMHAFGKAKETQEALRIYERMKKSGCTPDALFYNSLIFILGKAGRLRDARTIFEEMPNNGITPSLTTYNTLISVICEHSQEEEALEVLREMKESSCKPDIRTYTPLLKMFCKKGRMKVLEYLLHDMIRKDISLDLGTFSLLVHGLCRASKLDGACLFFEEMVIRGLVPKYNTFRILREELDRMNMRKEKERIEQLMNRAESQKQLGRHMRLQIGSHTQADQLVKGHTNGY